MTPPATSACGLKLLVYPQVATNLQQQRLIESGQRAEVSSSTVLNTSFEGKMRQLKDESVQELQASHQAAQLEITKLKVQIAEAPQSSYYYIDAGCVSRVSRWLAMF